MKNFTRKRIAVAAFGLAAFTSLPQPGQAAVSVPTVGIYDEGTNSNQVDRNANGNLITATGPNDVLGFTQSMTTAFDTDFGGLIDFETSVTNNQSGPISATFGTSQSKTLSIGVSASPSILFNFQSSGNVSNISGSNFFFNSVDDGTDFTRFTFGAITNGAFIEAVTSVGFTVLGRSSGVSTTVAATATFSDLSTAVLGPVSFTSDGTFATQDTFYGFSAPAGQSIDNVLIQYIGSGDVRRGIDDFGFTTTAVPEPGSFAMLIVGGLSLLVMRRRRA